MANAFDITNEITSGELASGELNRALRDFSQELGWRPSYNLIEPPLVNDIVKAHVVVEHGLEPSAIITFLNTPIPFPDMQLTEQYKLLEISYNNLVDWHLYVESNKVSFCFNRRRPIEIETQNIMTCPPKTEPVVVLDWQNRKGRQTNGQEGVQTGADHQQTAGS